MPKQKASLVNAVTKKHRFPGSAGADLPSARNAWKRIYGACPATVLPGSVLIAAGKMGSGISKRENKTP